MNKSLIGILGLALAALSHPALAAAPAVDREVEVEAESGEGILDLSRYEEVNRIPLLTRAYSFDVIDEDTLILWRTRRDPYLIKLKWPSPDLRFAYGIGVTSFGSQIHRFDDVVVRGLRYPIDRIYKLDREEAERLEEIG